MHGIIRATWWCKMEFPMFSSGEPVGKLVKISFLLRGIPSARGAMNAKVQTCVSRDCNLRVSAYPHSYPSIPVPARKH
ncbi:hypothetical protein RB195_010615 [Necator americanus]|uniref:Uncharacterized protein n=1 Tax=Necator americanus TaxID=51031 RepID=A0ABR1CYQ8_NECAM